MTNIEQFTLELMLAHDIDYNTALSRAEEFYKMLDTDRPEVLNDWISVDDRLPENIKDVIAFDDQGSMAIAYYNRGKWDSDPDILWMVTHWQPLPKPPKGK